MHNFYLFDYFKFSGYGITHCIDLCFVLTRVPNKDPSGQTVNLSSAEFKRFIAESYVASDEEKVAVQDVQRRAREEAMVRNSVCKPHSPTSRGALATEVMNKDKNKFL